MNMWTWMALVVAGGCGAMARFEVDAWVARVRARRRCTASGHEPGAARDGGCAGELAGRAGRSRREGVLQRRLDGVPLGTLVVNVSACFILGVLTGALSGQAGQTGQPGQFGASVLAVLGTGFCGGYSTFSTASVEAGRLILAGRAASGITLALVMTLLCQGAAVLGLLLGVMLSPAL